MPAPVVDVNSIRPREALLAIWRRWVEYRGPNGDGWGDERNARSAVVDAERLECLLLPAFWTEAFSLDDPQSLAFPELARALEGLSAVAPRDDVATLDGAQDLAAAESTVRAILTQLTEYVDAWSPRETDQGTSHDFDPGDYLEFNPPGSRRRVSPKAEKRLRGDVRGMVDAYTMSLSVCLQGKHLLTEWLGSGRLREPLRTEAFETRSRLSDRLTAAMLGLCRSFAASPVRDWAAMTGLDWPSTETPAGAALEQVRRRLRSMGYLDQEGDEGRPFEIGWTWGLAPQPSPLSVEYDDVRRESRLGSNVERAPDVAQALPYLYFTLGAIEGISDLLSQKVRSAAVLDRSQAFLAARLTFLAEQSVQYWTTLARFERRDAPGRWAIEDVPWQTSDGDLSEYWTLYLLSILLSTAEGLDSLHSRDVLTRYLGLAEELAQRGRITRKAIPYVIETLQGAGREQRSGSAEGDEGGTIERRLRPAGEDILRAAFKDDDDAQEQRRRATVTGFTPREKQSDPRWPLPDPALALHNPGIRIRLSFDEDYMERLREDKLVAATKLPSAELLTYDFAPRLLKLAGVLESSATDAADRARARRLIEGIWHPHLTTRRVGAPAGRTTRPSYAWDDNATVGHREQRSINERSVVESWYITERVVEALVQILRNEEVWAPEAPAVQGLVAQLSPVVRALALQSAISEVQRAERLQEIELAEQFQERESGRALGSLITQLTRFVAPESAGKAGEQRDWGVAMGEARPSQGSDT